MKKYKWISLLLFIVVLLCIVTFHSYFELVRRVTPPSEMWGRSKDVAVTSFKKYPVIYDANGFLNIIYGDTDNFKKIRVDDKGEVVDIQPLLLQEYQPEKIVKYEGARERLLWTENYDLFYIDLSGGKETKTLLASGINDFKMIDSEEGILIASAEKEKLVLYRLGDGKLEKLAEKSLEYEIDCLTGISDGKQNFHVAAVSTISPSEYSLRLFTYNEQPGILTERMKPKTIENQYSSREGSNSINNLQIGLDGENMYIIYELGKMSGQGVVAKTFMGILPKNRAGAEEVKFSRLKLKDQDDREPYITSLHFVDSQSGQLNAILATRMKASARDESCELVFGTLDKGSIGDKQVVTNSGRWNNQAQILNTKAGYITVYLETLGNSEYRINMSSSADAYKSFRNRTTFDDVKRSVMETLAAYVISIFPVYINLLIMSPLLLLPICVDFFEWRLFFRNPRLTFRITAVLEALIMVFSVNKIYKNDLSVSFMPRILKFTGSPFFYMLITYAAAHAIVYYYRKGKVDLHSLPETGLFILVHNIFVYFLYAAYMVQF